MVSVCIVTYNHKPYISRTIDSVLMQKCTFPIELIIGDDNSIDGTSEIIQKYHDTYKTMVKVRVNSRNLGQQKNGLLTLSECHGKYIAICDGDDYWRDPLKLQKQVAFLEQYPNYVLCYHDSVIVDAKDKLISESYAKNNKIDYSQDQLGSAPFIITSNVVYRNLSLPKYYLEENAMNGDILLWSKLAHHGEGKYLNNITPSAYRIHEGGWSARNRKKKISTDVYDSMIIIYLNNKSKLLKRKITKMHLDLFQSCLRRLDLKLFSKLNKNNRQLYLVSVSDVVSHLFHNIKNKFIIIK